MSRKAAIQLSANFLVIIIISIVVFGMGIYLVRRFVDVSEEKIFVMDQQMQDEIEGLLDDGSKVAIPFDHKTIPNRQYGKFGVGLLNVIDRETADFKITVSFSKAFDGTLTVCDTTAISPQSCPGGYDPDAWLRSASQAEGPLVITKTLRKYEQEKFLIGVEVRDAEKGSYLFDVNVKALAGEGESWEDYGTPHILIVDVPA